MRGFQKQNKKELIVTGKNEVAAIGGCGRPHDRGPLPLVCIRSHLDEPLPPTCGRPLWTTSRQFYRKIKIRLRGPPLFQKFFASTNLRNIRQIVINWYQ